MILCEQVGRGFRGRGGDVVALEGINLTVERGEFLVVKGPSGCGKSTLLLVLGGMQRPSSGRLVFMGQDLYRISARERNRVRSMEIGFVFQLFHLIPYLNVRENILAGLPAGADAREGAARADTLLNELGLQARAAQFPGTLSAGERQRVGLARALVKNPAIVLADEPTGNLDPANAAEVFRHLDGYKRAGGTVVVVTHGLDAAPFATRTVQLRGGRLVATEEPTSPSGRQPTPISV